MTNQKPRILAVGPRAAFGSLLEALEAREHYQFDYVNDSVIARASMQPTPDAVLLYLPADREASEEARAWMRTIKGQVPVVVVSNAADLDVYLCCMSCGAFDYLTSYSPVEEVVHVLDTAVRWAHPVAA